MDQRSPDPCLRQAGRSHYPELFFKVFVGDGDMEGITDGRSLELFAVELDNDLQPETVMRG